MANMLNSIVIEGRIEEKKCSEHTDMVEFTICTERWYKNLQGKKEIERNYIPVIFNHKLGDIFFNVGDTIRVVGCLRQAKNIMSDEDSMNATGKELIKVFVYAELVEKKG